MSELLKINVSDHTEKKNGLTYLSWAWAWAEVLKIDPQATWEAVEFDGFPASFAPDGSAMVKTIVTIKGHAKSCWLPVMNHRNQAIKGPDAFAINTAIVRCLTKCISMHGLGLYIYAGEDLPESDEPEQKEEPAAKPIKHSPVPDLSELNLDAEQIDRIKECAVSMELEWNAGNELACIDLYYQSGWDSEEKIGLWKLLGHASKLRSFIKANKPEAFA